MNNSLSEKWNKYNAVRVSGDKKSANRMLTEFIRLLKAEEYAVRKEFADNVCLLFLKDTIASNNGTEVSGMEVRIQHPLFKEIILPILIQEYKNNSPVHIRWIAQFEQFFYNDRQIDRSFEEAIRKEGHFDSVFFLEKAFESEHTPVTVNLLLERIAQTLNYYVHEVPYLVLVDPEVLEEEIIRFKKYYSHSENQEIWQKALSYWELISYHWKTYLQYQNDYSGFMNYLDSNQVNYK